MARFGGSIELLLAQRNSLDFLAGPETVFWSQTVKYAEAFFLEIGKGQALRQVDCLIPYPPAVR